MKKIYRNILLTLSISFGTHISTYPMLKAVVVGGATGYFAYHHTPEIYMKYFGGTETKQLLGFNPQYQNLPENENDKTPRIIYCSGQNGAERLDFKCDIIYNTLFKPVIFDYQLLSNESGLVGKLRSMNIGSTRDAEIALYALKKCVDNNCPAVIVGLSQGGATAITLLHMLTFPNRYKGTWKKFGMSTGLFYTPDDKKIAPLRKGIKKTFINNPFLGLGYFLNFHLGLNENSVFSKVISTGAKLGMKLGTKFDFTDRLTLLKELTGQGWNIDFGVAQKDEQLGNATDSELKKLCDQEKDWNFHNQNKHHLDCSTTIESIQNMRF